MKRFGYSDCIPWAKKNEEKLILKYEKREVRLTLLANLVHSLFG